MLRAAPAVACLALLLLPALPAHYGWSHCAAPTDIGVGSAGHPSSWSQFEVEARVAGWDFTFPSFESGWVAKYYLVIDETFEGHLLSVWIYEESNWIRSLQRGDDVCDESLPHEVPPDSIIL